MGQWSAGRQAAIVILKLLLMQAALRTELNLFSFENYFILLNSF
jgi:hypothetical protein